ncbi:unnamed protein product [Haemonchus placei]|uniref:Uncharacterized protein n=1 Tax=Haemonchus placei TaxID=6290 RepID=A0A0N4WWJ1_HAEPC|nr:unnamed protein product [Haemonchus placei]
MEEDGSPSTGKDKYRREECQWSTDEDLREAEGDKNEGRRNCAPQEGAYVAPYNSLIGFEWIRASEEMRYHLEMMTAEVNVASAPGIEEELRKTHSEVFKEGLGRCNKKLTCSYTRTCAQCSVDRLMHMDAIAPASHSE